MHSPIGLAEDDISSTIYRSTKNNEVSNSLATLNQNGSNNTSYSVGPHFIGQLFGLYKEAKDNYFRYATNTSFLVREFSTKVRDGKLLLRRFVC